MGVDTTPQLGRAEQLFWLRVPSLVSRYWFVLGNSLTDGIHLVRYRAVGTWAPPIAFVVGLVLVGLHNGPAFTSSRVVMVVAVAIAVSSVQLAFWTWLGYSLAYLVVGEGTGRAKSIIETWIGTPGAKLTALLLFWLFTVAASMAILAVRMDVRRRSWDSRYGRPVVLATYLVTVGVIGFFVTRSVPLLVRPIFTWQGVAPTSEAVVPIQSDWWIVVVFALIAAAIRLVVENKATTDRVISAITELSRSLSTPSETASAGWPRWARIAVPSIGFTFLLASLIENVLQAVGVAAFFGAIFALRASIVRNGSMKGLGRVPIIFRLAIGIAATWAITRIVLGFGARRIGQLNSGFRTDSFIPALIAVLLSLAIFLVLTAPQLDRVEVEP